MGILDGLRKARERRQLEAEREERERKEQAERARLAERDRKAAGEAEKRRREEAARQKLPQIRKHEAGAAQRMPLSQPAKEAVRQVVQEGPKPERLPEKKPEPIATERERKLHPVIPPPTIGPGGVSRTTMRETLAAKLQRETREAPPRKLDRIQQLDQELGRKFPSPAGGRKRTDD